MKIVAVIQARTGSSRLPGKILLEVMGKPLLELMLERVRAARELDEVVVATTSLPVDDPIRDLSRRLDVACVSGHPLDLLDRHLQAAQAAEADAAVKIPSDCPLIDPRVIDQVVSVYRRHADRYDFVSNLHPATWPDGNDVEVVSRRVLEEAHREAQRGYEREHTTPFVWDRPERYRLGNVVWSTGLNLADSHRLTLDYPEDFRLIARVFEALQRTAEPPFSVEDIVAYLDAHPAVAALNAARRGTGWIDRHRHELRTLQPRLPGQLGTGATAAGTSMSTEGLRR